jgi:cytochrome c-type biogenesis protein CcmH/NrfF
MQCGISPAWSQRILQLLVQGESEEVILAGFASEFGISVLMEPPLEGFNWVGYFLPWVAILTTAVVVGTVLRKRAPLTEPNRGRRKVSPEDRSGASLVPERAPTWLPRR